MPPNQRNLFTQNSRVKKAGGTARSSLVVFLDTKHTQNAEKIKNKNANCNIKLVYLMKDGLAK